MKFFIPLLGLIGFSLQIANGQSNTYEYYKPQGAAATNQQQPLADSRADNYYYNQDTSASAAAYQNYDTASAYSTQNFQQIDRQVFDDLGPFAAISALSVGGVLALTVLVAQGALVRYNMGLQLGEQQSRVNPISSQVSKNADAVQAACSVFNSISQRSFNAQLASTSSTNNAYNLVTETPVPVTYLPIDELNEIRQDIISMQEIFKAYAPKCDTS